MKRILCAALLCGALALILFTPASKPLPGAHEQDRQLLRIWVVSSVGGGDTWLRTQLQAFEKRNPGVMTYLRTVSPEELLHPNAVLPDLVLYTPGTLTDPQQHFTPIADAPPLNEALLRCGRWQGVQYALPLCWGAYVLCIDSAFEPQAATTPAPTTLLGRPAATPSPAETPQPYPYEAVSAADTPLLSPAGSGTFTLCMLLDAAMRPVLPAGNHFPADVYARFRSRQCASAVLTTGQVTALSGLTAGGKGFTFRTMVPDVIITDQVLLGSVVKGAEHSAAPQLLAFLTAPEAQQALCSQSLHTVRSDLKLYISGVGGQVESSARQTLAAINAFVSPQDASAAAWQVYTGQITLNEALLPLL